MICVSCTVIYKLNTTHGSHMSIHFEKKWPNFMAIIINFSYLEWRVSVSNGDAEGNGNGVAVVENNLLITIEHKNCRVQSMIML